MPIILLCFSVLARVSVVLFISALFKLLPRENAVQDIDPRDRLMLFSCFSLMFSLARCVWDEIYFVLLLLILSLLLLQVVKLQKSLLLWLSLWKYQDSLRILCVHRLHTISKLLCKKVRNKCVRSQQCYEVYENTVYTHHGMMYSYMKKNLEVKR